MNFSIEVARGTDSSMGVDDVLMVGACSTLGKGGGNVFGSQTHITCQKGVTDESAVDSVMEIEGWRLPRERRDVYDADEVRVSSNQTGGRGAMTVVKSQMSIEGPAVILLAFRPARGGGHRAKDDRLGVQRGKKSIVQGSSHEYANLVMRP